MNRRDVIFTSRSGESGAAWGLGCIAMSCAVVAGYACGQLLWSCLGLIAAFAVWRGGLPYLKHFGPGGELPADRKDCRDEREILIDVPAERKEEVLSIDSDGVGSVMHLVRMAAGSHGRLTPDELWETFAGLFDSHWEQRLGPLKDAAEQAPVLGLAGSMLGLVDALSVLAAGADKAALYEAMSTTSLTTLAGGAAYVLLSGLHRAASNQVNSHRGDLEFVSRNILRAEAPRATELPRPDSPLDVFSPHLNGRKGRA